MLGLKAATKQFKPQRLGHPGSLSRHKSIGRPKRTNTHSQSDLTSEPRLAYRQWTVDCTLPRDSGITTGK